MASGAFWRLRHVTQVMTPSAPGHFHNRLSHSLAVARIGRRMATSLLGGTGGATAAEGVGGLDPDVVAAACLAHDLGHPPFGHDAEEELDRALTAAGVADGFEANAQSFRIVTTLDRNGTSASGLNLTRATTAAILKYPWTRAESPVPGKWGVYESEGAELAWARELLPRGRLEPTLEAAVMDLADLIAYAVHDFEDFVCAGAIPMERLRADRVERERFLGLVGARRRIPDGERDDLSRLLASILAACPRGGRATIGRYTARRIDEVIEAVSLASGRAGGSAIVIDRERELEILLLEGLTWHYVIDSDLLHPQRNEQRRIIRALFERLTDAVVSKNDLDALPPQLREPLQNAASDSARLRLISDYLASLTETEAIAKRSEITGTGTGMTP